MTPDLLTEYLAATGDRCPRCRAEIDANTSLCRRCRTPVRLSLGTERPYAIAWAVALAGAALSTGFGMIVAGLGLVRGELPSYGNLRPALVLAIVIGGAMTMAGVLLLAFRRRFVILPALVQWMLAVAAVATVVLSFAWMAVAQR